MKFLLRNKVIISFLIFLVGLVFLDSAGVNNSQTVADSYETKYYITDNR